MGVELPASDVLFYTRGSKDMESSHAPMRPWPPLTPQRIGLPVSKDDGKQVTYDPERLSGNHRIPRDHP